MLAIKEGRGREQDGSLSNNLKPDLSPDLHLIRETCRLIRRTKSKQVDGENGIDLSEHLDVPASIRAEDI